MNIAIVGLGLIGGSLGRALCKKTDHTVFASDIDSKAMSLGKLLSAYHKPLTNDNIGQMDLVIFSLYPEILKNSLEEYCPKLKKGAIVMDISGVKRYVCDALYETSKENGFIFIGAHPMAGLHLSGFEHSTAKIFNNSSMILTPYEDTPWGYINTIKELFLKIGFTNIQMSTPDEHDKIIAFTSQLAHIVSNAYVKSPNALIHKGFSAGSYKDLTRVAYLNENMWSELFLENRDNLINEIDSIVNNLVQYKEAMENNDRERLEELLRDGKLLKEQIDG